MKIKIYCFSFKEDWDGASADHEIKTPRIQEKNNQRSTRVSQITGKWKLV
jgi:hypothetical protein